jgi:long-chain acyl-CoA synthetase
MDPRTLTDVFYGAVARHKPAQFRYKRGEVWHDVASAEVRRSVEELSEGLVALGVVPGDRVAILSENRPEWAYADYACLTARAIDAPIYPTLTAGQVAYILKDSGARAVFVSDPEQAGKVAEQRAGLPDLEHVIRMQDGPGFPEGTLSLEELRAKGRPGLEKDPGIVKRRAAHNQPDDVATLIYTSGTTGDPKGVMLTHGNITTNVLGGLEVFAMLGPDDVALSFLPLCHSFERMAGHYLMHQAGATVCFAENVATVPQNMLEVRPTVMCSVPRLYEKIYARIQDKVAQDPPLSRKIFNWALGVGRAGFEARLKKRSPGPWLRLQAALAEALVFGKIKQRTGGRLRLFVSGGAPLAREIAEFFGAVGLLVCEGYGLTETSPVIAVNRPDDVRPGSVGQAIRDVEIRIAEDGEILTRGPHIMKGYWNQPEATAEAIDSEGWFHTGDIGHLDERGFLTITDRKKDLIVTSGGKNIAPQPIENKVKTHPLVAEIVMVGNKRNFCSALVLPAFENLEPWAKQQGIGDGSREALVENPKVVEHYEKLVAELTADLAQYEKIKKIALLTEEFTIESGELTPTLKVKRRVVEERYAPVIDRLYA